MEFLLYISLDPTSEGSIVGPMVGNNNSRLGRWVKHTEEIVHAKLFYFVRKGSHCISFSLLSSRTVRPYIESKQMVNRLDTKAPFDPIHFGLFAKKEGGI